MQRPTLWLVASTCNRNRKSGVQGCFWLSHNPSENTQVEHVRKHHHAPPPPPPPESKGVEGGTMA